MGLGRELSKAFSGLEKRISYLEKENARLRKKVEGETVRKRSSRAAKKVGKRGPGRPPKEVANEEVKPKRRGRPPKKAAPKDNTPKKRGRPPIDRSIPVKVPKKRGRPPLPEHLLKHNPFAHRLKLGEQKVEYKSVPEPIVEQEAEETKDLRLAAQGEIYDDKDLLELAEVLPKEEEDDDDGGEDEDWSSGVSEDIPFADDDEPDEDADDE